MPRKPTSPAGHVAFPKHGPPYVVSDTLPPSAPEIEAHVVDVFAARLRELGRAVGEPRRPESPWPDAELEVDGALVGIEVVEVVDPAHRQQVEGQEWYQERIREAVVARSLDGVLAGMDLSLFAELTTGLPPAGSRDAQELVNSLVSELELRRRELQASPVNIARRVDVEIPPWTVSMTGWRVALNSPGYRLRWGNAYLVDPLCLARRVEAKIAKHYPGKHGYHLLWLLAWDSFGYLITSEKDRAISALSQRNHSFDRAWTCYLGGGSLVVVEQLWVREGQTT